MTTPEKLTLRARLSIIQRTLDVPKTHYNAHGGFYYRNAEDILDAVKKLLIDGETIETGDVLENIGDRYYCKATAYFANETEMISKDAYAREADEQKGMQASQLSGSTSSYARKYALNGLFAIDDVKDADSMDNTPSKQPARTTSAPTVTSDPVDEWDGIEASAKPKDLGTCPKCGAPNAWSVKSNKAYCSALCWKK